MPAEVIDGRACARELAAELGDAVRQLRAHGAQPHLATVIVGSDYGAAMYERRVRRVADMVGVGYVGRQLPADVSQAELLRDIQDLNRSSDISGILVLRPLPAHIDEAAVFQSIAPEKDVESVHPTNAGLLALGVPRFVPSTAAAAFHLLDRWLDAVGECRTDFYRRSKIVVVGRSNNVGKPCVSLSYSRQAAVESIDEWASRTGQLGRHTRRADVLIVAAGSPHLIKAEHVSPNAVVIDIGINAVPDGRDGSRLVGDVDFHSVSRRARAITPVPGGVGPVTDLWVLRNTLDAASSIAGASTRVAS